ncbi:MAG: hypothetical protein HUU35_13800, partial [Armatimonadetes bacterium]|nr:hypothetical protein [Armatimonadota bacterium]
LTVQGTLLPPPGAVVVVDHAGQRGSAYTVVASEQTADQTVLKVAEDPGFTWDAATATAQFACRPGTTHVGPHTVSWRPIASGRLGGGQ